MGLCLSWVLPMGFGLSGVMSSGVLSVYLLAIHQDKMVKANNCVIYIVLI